MKASEVAEEVKQKESFKKQYYALGKRYREQVKDQVNRRTHQVAPTPRTIISAVNGLKDWVKAAVRELEWEKENMVEVLWQHHSAILLENYEQPVPDEMDKTRRVVEEELGSNPKP